MESKPLESAFACASLGDMTDHIEHSVHPALREHLRSLDRAVAELDPQRPDSVMLRSLIGQIGVATVAQTNFEVTVLFPQLRAIERARFGEAAWPRRDAAPSLEECRNKLRAEHNHLRSLLDALTTRAAGHVRVTEVAAAMIVELEQHAHLEDDELFPRGLGIEPHFELH